ncbi:MAG: hypothetical protein NTV79_03315, partial [Candidatus Aureabacteria bacterium]|nr:hypothetical protein [Candidatus Auribacterota bacterium]
MNANDLVQASLYFLLLLGLTPLLGAYLFRALGTTRSTSPAARMEPHAQARGIKNFGIKFENAIFRWAGIDIASEMTWKEYA